MRKSSHTVYLNKYVREQIGKNSRIAGIDIRTRAPQLDTLHVTTKPMHWYTKYSSLNIFQYIRVGGNMEKLKVETRGTPDSNSQCQGY